MDHTSTKHAHRPVNAGEKRRADLVSFMLRGILFFFVCFCRAVVDIADNGDLGFFPDKPSPLGRRPPTTPLRPTTSGKFTSDNQAEISPITSGRYVVFVGKDVGHTASRHVDIVSRHSIRS